MTFIPSRKSSTCFAITVRRWDPSKSEHCKLIAWTIDFTDNSTRQAWLKLIQNMTDALATLEYPTTRTMLSF